MKRGTKAQLFTLDLLLALIPLTIALGMSANAISGVATQMQDYTHWYPYHRMVNDAMDVLIKTPGEPPDWNSTDPPSTLGLANYTNTSGVGPYYLDDMKVGALNASISGGLLYQVGLSQLLGNESFPYLSISFIGATVNTSNLTIAFTNGSRNDVSNIYAAQRLALLEVEKILTELDDVARTPVSEKACDTSGQPTYYMSFYVSSADAVIYDYWIVAEVKSGDPANADAFVFDESYVFSQSGNITDCSWVGSSLPHYNIYPNTECGGTACGTPCTATCCEEITSEFKVTKIQIDDTTGSKKITTGTTNYVFIKLQGVPSTQTSYYVIRAPSGTCNEVVEPAFAGFGAVTVTLEVGR